MKALSRPRFLQFVIGGSLYALLEILWRGATHGCMVFVGGACFVLLRYVEGIQKLRFAIKCVVGGVVVCAVELVSGIVLNRWLGLKVWDYSQKRFNLLGQICLHYFALWCLLSGFVFVLFGICKRFSHRAIARLLY